MVVSEGAINNIMGGMENTAGVRLHSHRHKLKQRFDIIRKLGQGTYGKVQLAVNKETGQEVAIKTIKKAKIETEQDLIRIRREIQIMSSVQHPQIIHIYEVFENREKMVLVMEYAAGGELYDYLSERKVLSEDEARRVFRHVASATYYCHKHKICHRDLKLENILLDLDGNAKIADFGLSNVFDEKHRLDTFCGSPLYASPEIVKGIPYTGPEVDCWSLGVLLYTLVYGAMPFDGSNFKRLVKQITQGDYYEPKKPSRASELIRRMLTVSASNRATVEEICSHWWVNEGFSEPCLEVAEALANQTPVRLDLLLSLAPKHINSEHMLIQPEEEDSSARSPPNSEVSRPPPNLKLPPPPPAEALPPQQVTPTRSASLGALSSVNSNEIEALVAQKMQQKKEEAEEEEEEEEQKRKAAEEKGTGERRKKKRDASDASLKSARKEQKRMDDTSVRHPPTDPDGESTERKKIPRQKETVESEELEKVEKQKSGDKKKRDSLLVDGEANDVSEKEKRRSVRKAEKEKEKVDGEKAERKKSVKKKESEVERDTSVSESVERTELKDVKKRDPAATPEGSVERKTGKKKDTSGDNLSRKDNSECPSLSVINGATEEEEEEVIVRGESGFGKESARPKLPKDKSPTPRGSTEGKVRSGELQESPMEVEEAVKKSPSKSRSGESKQSRERTLKTSGSSGSRDSTSSAKQLGGAVSSTTSSLAPSQESPRKKPSPPPGAASQPPKVSDARKAFEAKPADKPSVVLRKKPSPETTPSSPTSAKDTPGVSSTKETVKGKSPARDKPLPAKETEKPREKSPRTEKDTPSRVGSKAKVDAEAEKKVEEPTKKEKVEVPKKTTPTVSTTEKAGKTEDRLVASRPPEGSRKPTPKEGKEETSEKDEKSSKSESKQILRHRESSESSESESEAERLLKILSEKREKVEAAKQEKLRKVSSTKEPQIDTMAATEEPQSPSKVSPSKSPSKASPTKSSEKTPPAPDTRETSQEHKFATLPRGFKTKGAQPNTSPAAAPVPSTPAADRPRKDRGAINQEIEGMMSAIKAVDQAITKGPSKGTPKTPEVTDTDRKKTKLEIVLNSKQPAQQPEAGAKRASYAEIKLSSPSTKEPPRSGGFRSEVCAKVGAVPAEPVPGPKHGPGPGPGEAQLQRAKRERIIPIMLEDDDEDEDTTASESHLPLDKPTNLPQPGLEDTAEHLSSSSSVDCHSSPFFPHSSSWRLGPSMSSGSTRITPFSQLPNNRPSEPRTPPVCTPAPEPIRKSRRERIIPIAVEGEGIMTPPPHMEEGPGIGAARAHQAFSRTLSGRPNTLGRGCGSGFLLDHSESFSSAGEEDEEDEDDGFQILTAESLFSTLLNRVRSLTRKMNAEDGRGDRARRTSNRPTPEPGGPPGMPGAAHSSSAGFWSSLYNSPRDSPARRISETMSRNSLGRDEDGLGGLGSPLWNRSVSRDPSDADTLFSEPSSASQFGTLPRGWRASRWSGGEDGGESDTSEASSVRSMGRRPQYYRAPSRELQNIPDEEASLRSGRGGYPGGGRSLPRPYSASSGSNQHHGRGMQDNADRIAMYGTLRGPLRRPHSTVGGTPGEYLGRDGGHCEQRHKNKAATQNDAIASQYSPSDSQHSSNDNSAQKQSVQEQLQQLVRELEEGDDSIPVGEQWGTGLGGARRPHYASNPALHLTYPTGLVRDHRSVSNADLTATAAPDSSTNTCLPPGETITNRHTSRAMPSSSMVSVDGNDHQAPPQAGGGGAVSLLNKEKTGNIHRVPSPRGEWARTSGGTKRVEVGSPVGRGGLNLHPYQRGRSEDLRHALDSLARMDSNKPRRVVSMAGEASSATTDTQKALQDCTADQLDKEDMVPSAKTLLRLLPASANESSDKNNNSSALGTRRSSSNIPVKSHTTSIANTSSMGSVLKKGRSNQSEIITTTTPTSTTSAATTTSTPTTATTTTTVPITTTTTTSSTNTSNNTNNLNNNKDCTSNIPPNNSGLVQAAKVYRKSKSRELTPGIEVASEKFNQLNSGTLKRISPFEAYRRSKSRELPLDHANANNIASTYNNNINKEAITTVRLKSPPTQVSPERPKVPLEKSKTFTEKSEVTKPPAREYEGGGVGRVFSPQPLANLSRSWSTTKSERLKDRSNHPTKVSGREDKDKSTEAEANKSHGREREAEKGEDKAKVKKTASIDPEKPKSMYKMLTSRFNRSASFVSDNTRPTVAEEEKTSEKDDKFRLKRPSRFLKPRTEKSASKTSVYDADEDVDKAEKKPSKKLTDALNKFLGRKDPSKEELRDTVNVAKTVSAVLQEEDQPQKLPRAKGKLDKDMFPTQKKEGDVETTMSISTTTTSTTTITTTNTTTTATTMTPTLPNYTLESVTKNICNHLSQLESDITSRIGNMGTQEQRGTSCGGAVLSGGSGGGKVVAAATISNYGLSPALANRRNGRPTNLDVAGRAIEGDSHTGKAPSNPPPGKIPAATKAVTSQINSTDAEGNKEKVGNHSETGTPTPNASECPEEQRGQSEAEDESVMDRITRKSYYSKFQEKKRPKLRRANTREDMDQQLAAAKARLLKEEREEAEARRLSSPRSPPPWDPHRPGSRTSLPPEDTNVLMQFGGRRGSSLQPDHLLGTLSSLSPREAPHHQRIPSLPNEDRYLYPHAPSVSREDYLPRCTRMQSSPPEELAAGPQSCRISSVAPDDFMARPVEESVVQNAMTAAVAAGSLAGQVAADGTLQQGEMVSREPSMNRMCSPEPSSVEETRSLAREELSRRLTHLTRLSAGGQQSGRGRSTPREGEQRPYRRTITTGRLAGESTGPPVYRRTNTMDLPPADARARPGSEYRRHLQDPARRHSAASWGFGTGRGRFTIQETLVEGELLTNPTPSTHSSNTPQAPYNVTRLTHPSPLMPPSHMHSHSSSSSSHFSSPSSYGSGPYPPSCSTLDSSRYTSPLGRRTSFYRY